MNDIKYSIIIPHKNTPDLLERCINSIPEADNIEIIVVDDDSDEKIVDFNNFPCNGRKNLILIFNKDCKGAGHARNLGLLKAKGIWVLFADSDDYYEESFIEILDQKLTSDIDILFFNIIEESNPYIKRIYYKYFYENGSEDDVRLIWSPWNKVFSRKFIVDNQIKFEEIPVGNDAMFSLKANFLANKILIIENKLYHYTVSNNNSITHSIRSFDRTMDYLNVNLRINSLLRKRNKGRNGVTTISPNLILYILKHYGIRKLIIYISYMYKNGEILKEVALWFNKKLATYK